jgi:2-polyprenyl-3-methyl-5-hydroxy-6-metoxy-1,4-benzoquinol methylase
MVRQPYFLSEKAIQLMNELYHDLIHDEYDSISAHPQTFSRESPRWKRITRPLIEKEYELTLCDIGSGTGLVPLSISENLKSGDLFICSDLSEEILKTAKENLNAQGFKCNFKFVRIEKNVPYTLPFSNEMFDIITINSVIHHVRDFSTFKKEVDRTLKPGGILIIGHEPNHYFYKSRLLTLNFFITKKLISLIRKVKKIFRKSKKNPNLKTLNKDFNLKITEIINTNLFDENLISNPLTIEQIRDNIDIRKSTGFIPERIFPNYKILYLETYDHLFSLSLYYNKNYMIEIYDSILKRLFQKKGRSFFIVLKK